MYVTLCNWFLVVINFALAKLLRTATEEKVRERERERGRVRKVH